MMGRLFLKTRQAMKFNPRVSYYRDVVRPRILQAPPLYGTADPRAEIHVLTSESDWLNLIWALRSFYLNVDTQFSLTIHGDKSLTSASAERLREQFPDARIIEQHQIEPEIFNVLSNYPRCREFRKSNTLAMKAFDFAHTLRSDKMILFDSDLLFFSRPIEFLKHVEGEMGRVNTFNRDIATAYALNITSFPDLGMKVQEEINSGFGLVHKESMRFDWMEEFLAIPGLAQGHFWRIEQTLYALCASRFGVKLLSDDYRVFLKGRTNDKPFRHYVGAVRNSMYGEGVRMLHNDLLLKQMSSS